jgi:hypothetical protein
LIFSFYRIIQNQGALEEKQIALNQLQTKFIKLDSEFKETLKSVSPLKEELLNLKKKLEEKEKYQSQLRKETEQAKVNLSRLNNLNSELGLMKIENSALEKINRSLQKDLSDTASRLESSQKRIRNLEDNIMQIKKMSGEDYFLFVLKNIHDKKFFYKYLFFTPVLILISVLMGKSHFARGLFFSLRRWPIFLKKRKTEKQKAIFSDREVLHMSNR